jgi:hypothetical protein
LGFEIVMTKLDLEMGAPIQLFDMIPDLEASGEVSGNASSDRTAQRRPPPM